MSFIHIKNAYAVGGLTGTQSTQRDWSPYLVHFTNWSAMEPLRDMAMRGTTPAEVRTSLVQADETSFRIVQQILQSRRLRASSPGHETEIPACICLSECNIPGLVSLSERFGRFGFVFRKTTLFQAGARPCVYVDGPMYGELKRNGTNVDSSQLQRDLFGLANVYRPIGSDGPLQDYTHEREWRLFADLSFDSSQPCHILAPAAYTAQVRNLATANQLDVNVIPIDTLFEWGA